MNLRDLIHVFEVASTKKELSELESKIVRVKGALMTTTKTAADTCRELAEVLKTLESDSKAKAAIEQEMDLIDPKS